MKKVLPWLLAAALMLAMTGCRGRTLPAEHPSPSAAPPTETAEANTTPVQTATPAQTTSTAEEPTATPAPSANDTAKASATADAASAQSQLDDLNGVLDNVDNALTGLDDISESDLEIPNVK